MQKGHISLYLYGSHRQWEFPSFPTVGPCQKYWHQSQLWIEPYFTWSLKMVKIHWSWIYRFICRKQATQMAFLTSTYSSAWTSAWSSESPDHEHYTGNRSAGKLAFLLNFGNDWECHKGAEFLCLFFLMLNESTVYYSLQQTSQGK